MENCISDVEKECGLLRENIAHIREMLKSGGIDPMSGVNQLDKGITIKVSKG